FGGISIENQRRFALQDRIVGEQPRKQGFAAAAMQRSDDVRVALRHRRPITPAVLEAAGDLQDRLGLSRCAVCQPIEQADTVKFADDLVEPGPGVATQHERVIRIVPLRVLILDEGRERYTRELYLFERHFVELRDIYLDSSARLFEIAIVNSRIPFEKARLIDEILDCEIVFSTRVGHYLGDFVE